MRLFFIALAVFGCFCVLGMISILLHINSITLVFLLMFQLLLLCIHSDVTPAQAQCYVAIRANADGATRIRVDSWTGRSSRYAEVDTNEGNKVYCVPTVCPEGYSYPARVSFYQPGKFFVLTCTGQREERLVYPGAPTCYGSYSACKRSNSPNVLFTTDCSYI